MSKSGYTNDRIGVDSLKHFIECTRTASFPSHEYILLIFDGQASHTSEEFIQLAAQNRIILHQFPLHLTHLMQPLDVGCFQSYKHWQKMAVHQAIRCLESNYNSACFLRDLSLESKL